MTTLNKRLVELNALCDEALVEFSNDESKAKRRKYAAVAGGVGLAGGLAGGYAASTAEEKMAMKKAAKDIVSKGKSKWAPIKSKLGDFVKHKV